MGQSVSLFLARAAGVLIAGMLLLLVFGHARAENYDGYGIKPLGGPDASDYGMKPAPNAPATNPNFYAAPPQGSYAATQYPQQNYAPPPQQPGYAPQQPGYAPPPQPGYAPPAAAPSYQPAPAAYPQSGYQPQPVSQAPQQQQQFRPVAAQTGPYGYRSGEGLDDAAAAAPAAYGGPAGMYANSPVSRPNPDYVLGPGDKLKLNVFDETDLSGDYTIDGSGLLRLPLIGQVRAAGYTAGQLEGSIANALAQGYLKSPRVAIEVSTYRPFYIIGAVNRPGEYPYVNHMNALTAIALAGGFQQSAVESTVYVRREGSNTEVAMSADRATMIYPGDVVRVKNTIFYDVMSVFSPVSGAAGIGFAAAAIH